MSLTIDWVKPENAKNHENTQANAISKTTTRKLSIYLIRFQSFIIIAIYNNFTMANIVKLLRFKKYQRLKTQLEYLNERILKAL